MKPLYLVVGVSGSGKSWVCRQLTDRYNYIPHDRCWVHPTEKPRPGEDPKWVKGAVSTHLQTLLEAAPKTEKPILTECPFGERELREQLECNGIHVIPVFVVEPPHVVEGRYFSREKKPIPKAALSRASSIINRALEWRAFHGTSDQVLKHLKEIPHGR